MKKSNLFLLAIAFSVILSEIYVCEAQYAIVAKGIGFVLKLAWKARTHLKEKNKPNEHAEQNKKLDKLSMKIASLEKEMVGHFKELLAQVKNVPNVTVHGQIASQFEGAMIGVQNKLEDLIFKKEKVNRGALKLDYHFKDDVYDLKTKIDGYKDDLEVLMGGRNLSHDFLSQVKNLANVCKDRMSQVQLLDSFRALYLDTMSRYLIGKHIVISLWESADNKTHHDKKRELNAEVSRYLVKYGKRFQQLMAQSSREYQDCTEPTEYYSIQKIMHSPKCFMPSDDKASSQIFKYDFGKHMQCDDYVSLRPVKARPGYVVVGAKIEHNANIIYIKVLEGKLLSDGAIDPETITYSNDPAPGIGDEVFHLPKAKALFDLTKAVANDDRVVTGLSFKVTADKHVYLDVITQQFNVNDGTLIPDTERSEPREQPSSEFQVIRNSHQRYNVTERNAIGLQPVKPQYVKLWPGPSKSYNDVVFWPIFDVRDVFPTPLTLLSGAGLYVNQVKQTQGYLSIRLFNFNVAPHAADLDFNIDENFEDALKDI